MDTMVRAFIKGKFRPLHYSMDVMFHVNEKFNSLHEAMELLEQDNREGFDTLRTLAVLMANDAELCRRDEGYEHNEIIGEKDISIRLTPGAFVALKQAVVDAITMGYKQEQEDENEEIDLGLLELQKKEEAGK